MTKKEKMNEVIIFSSIRSKLSRVLLEKRFHKNVVSMVYLKRVMLGDESYLYGGVKLTLPAEGIDWGSKEYVRWISDEIDIVYDYVMENNEFAMNCIGNSKKLSKDEWKLFLEYGIAIWRLNAMVQEVHYILYEWKDEEKSRLN